MDCPARQLCVYLTSTIPLTTDFCGTIPRATIKATNLRQLHGKNCIVKVFLLSEREISPNYTSIFLRFRPRIRFICEWSAENETMQFGDRYGFGSVSVRIRCICETALIITYTLMCSAPHFEILMV